VTDHFGKSILDIATRRKPNWRISGWNIDQFKRRPSRVNQAIYFSVIFQN